MKKLMILLSFSCLSLLSLASTVWATNNIYVDVAACPNQGSGREEDPFCDIQDGIDLAVDGDHVVIAQGVYTRDRSKNLDFHGKKITVRSTVPENPEVVEQTVIDCQKNGRGFYLHSGETLESVIDGLTITGGYPPNSYGGGILIKPDEFGNNSSAIIRNCIIRGNEAPWHGGGGIYIDDGNTRIIHSTITSNIAGTGGPGGGIFYEGHIGNGSSLSIENCIISSNKAWRTGGIYLDWNYGTPVTIVDSVIENNDGPGISDSYTYLSISNSLIRNNTNGRAGGIDVDYGGSLKISDSVIEYNAGGDGWGEGGIRAESVLVEISDSIIRYNTGVRGGVWISEPYQGTFIQDTIISDNSADKGLSAGGIGFDRTRPRFGKVLPEIRRCSIMNNVGHGIEILDKSDARISDTIIANNQGQGVRLGSLHGDANSVEILNSTVVNNTENGVAVYAYLNQEPSTGLFRNSIFWGNNEGNHQIYGGEEAVVDINYCNIEKGEQGIFSPVGDWRHILDVDPLFINPEATDYHLASSSPLINAGNPRYKPVEGQTDIDGDPRIMQRIVDIGADETLAKPVGIRWLSAPR